MTDVVPLLLGLALLAATAWSQPRLTRLLGSLLFGLVVGVVLRFVMGPLLGAACGLLGAGLAYRVFPGLVLRRRLPAHAARCGTQSVCTACAARRRPAGGG